MPIKSKYVFVASMDVDADKEALFNEVYDTEHVPNLLKVNGWRAGEPFGEAVEAAQVRRQAGHAHHRWRIRGTPPPYPEPAGLERDVGVLVSHGLLHHVGALLCALVRPRIARR